LNCLSEYPVAVERRIEEEPFKSAR